MKGEAALSGVAKWYLGHHRNASVPLAGPGVVGVASKALRPMSPKCRALPHKPSWVCSGSL